MQRANGSRSSAVRVAVIAVALSAVTGLVRADEDQPAVQPVTTQPATTQPESGRPFGPGRMGGFRNRMHPNGNGDRPAAAPSDADWDKASAFMQEHSPRRLIEFQEMPAAQPARKTMVKQLIVSRFSYIDGLKQTDPKMYDLQVNKIETEDHIFGMLRDHPHDSMSEEDKMQFKSLVSKLVSYNLDERQQRIDSASDSLEKAKSSLAHDRDQQDKLIEQRMADLVKTGARPLKLQNTDDGGDPRPDKPKPTADQP